MTGQKFGRLTVLRRDETKKTLAGRYPAFWIARCDCGKERSVNGALLRSGNTRSCGCLMREINAEMRRTHGMRDTRVYGIWMSMKARCRSQSHPQWKDYGGRGIKVCERWQQFENFFADMGHPPTDRHSIDRINNDGNYEPGNCRWATPSEQARNRRSNTWVEIDGERKVLSQWADDLGMDVDAVLQRISRGWDPARALTEPFRRHESRQT